LIAAKWSNWWGGDSFGYRLIIDLLPILMLFVVDFWERHAARTLVKFLFPALILVSVFMNFLGATMHRAAATMDSPQILIGSGRSAGRTYSCARSDL
jgi:hypothetical protein